MKEFKIPSENKNVILALGAESAGNFSVFKNGLIHFSQDFGDLSDDANYRTFEKELSVFIKKEKIKPDVILHDLHPLLKTTALAQKLAKKFKAETFPVQHHLAHIFSQLGNAVINNPKKLKSYSLKSYYGIALDGTGYGTDGKIWGGEVFKLEAKKLKPNKLKAIRIGHLENQVMIGGELAIMEPARMLLAILARIKNQESRIKNDKEFIYKYLKKHYSRNEFELLYNQLQSRFNCIETSSAGRVLDAVAVLLGFAKNERNFKHEATYLLEKNSSQPYQNLKPKLQITNYKLRVTSYELLVTPLFEYLIKNLHKDKKRLAATAQLYIAEGLDEIINLSCHPELVSGSQEIPDLIRNDMPIILSGGISNNKIISDYFEKLENKKPGISIEMPGIPRGDAGISFGQIIFRLAG